MNIKPTSRVREDAEFPRRTQGLIVATRTTPSRIRYVRFRPVPRVGLGAILLETVGSA